MERKVTSGVMLSLLLMGTLTLAFNIQPAEASGTIYIRADGSVDPDTAAVQRDENIYTLTSNIYDEIVVERDNIVVDGVDYAVQGPGSTYYGTGIYLSHRSNVTIVNMEIVGFYYGIRLDNSSNSSISGNTMRNNRYSIYLYKSSDNKIFGNTLWKNWLGINLDESSRNRVYLNNILDNESTSITLNASLHNRISRNNIISSGGISLEGFSTHNIVSGNQIDGRLYSPESGIRLLESSNNEIYGNSIKNKTFGIMLRIVLNSKISGNNISNNNFGIELVQSITNSFTGNNITNNYNGMIELDSSYNEFHHNNFINNTVQITSYYGISINTWDDGSEGNHWSDYNGTDNDGDGIGDTPYHLNVYNQDNYPLMNPIIHPAPILTSVDYLGSVELGQWATITITARNDGGTAEWQTIHCGFPSNPPPENIEIVSHNCNGGAQIYLSGTKLPADYGEYTIISEYIMTEAVHGPWPINEVHSMTVRVKTENTGTFTFYVKTVNHAGGVTHYDSTDMKDQQDEYVYVYEISVPSTHRGLIEQYFPYLIFDEKERYYPTDFYHDDTDINNNPSNYEENTWPLTVYAHIVEGRWRDWARFGLEPIVNDYLVIQYWFYYAKDPKMWEIAILGAHDHDWESVFIFLEKKDPEPEPEWVVYFHHYGGVWWIGDKQDSWDLVPWENPLYPAGAVEKVDETHPVVHVARHSHASYPWTTAGLSRPVQSVLVPVVEISPPYFEVIELPYAEQCDGGLELGYESFEIVTVGEPSSDWPNMFGEIPAPWAKDDANVRIRRRWDDPGYLLRKIEKLSIMAMSPVNLLVTAPDDFRVGYNTETESVVNEIKYAEYSGVDSEPQVITILDPLPGDYIVDVFGTGTGNYVIMIESTAINGTVISTLTLNGTASEGRFDTYLIELEEDYSVRAEIQQAAPLPWWILGVVAVVMVGIGVTLVLWKRRKPKITST